MCDQPPLVVVQMLESHIGRRPGEIIVSHSTLGLQLPNVEASIFRQRTLIEGHF